MAVIALEGMKFYAYHGVYEAEKLIGTDYVVDVYVQTVTALAAKTDQLEATVNYESIFQICKMEMQQPRQLIETVVAGIVKGIKNQFPNMMALKVRVKKLNPPLGGRVDAAWVEEEEMFMQTCPKCNKPFINYSPNDCWERFPNVHPATKETLLKQFGGRCLCNDCLKFYAG
jgi:dihydroneopterin aldolase